MLLVQLLDPKWCFIYITDTHAVLGDDPAEGHDCASVVYELGYMFLNDFRYYVDISIVIKYFTYILF